MDTLSKLTLPLNAIEGEIMNERKEETAVFENRQLENLGPKQVKAIRGGLGGMFAVWRGTAHAWGEL